MDVPKPPGPPRPPQRRGPKAPRGPRGPRRSRRPVKTPPPGKPPVLPPGPDTNEWSPSPAVLEYLKENAEKTLELVDRDTWGAELPTIVMPLLELPVKRVQFFLRTGTPSCDSFKSCTRACREIQDRHMNKAMLDDIAYNFLVGEDGRIYEGRSWEYEGFDARGGETLNIAFIGSHTPKDIGVDLLDKALAFIYISMAEKKIKDDYETTFYTYRCRKGTLKYI